MRKYLLFLPLLLLFGMGSASAVELAPSLDLRTQFPDLNTQGLEVIFNAETGEVSLKAGSLTTAQLTELDGSSTDYIPDGFDYSLTGNVNNLAGIDFSASTADSKVDLTGNIVSFASGVGVLEFLVDVVSTGTVDFGTKLGIIVTNLNSDTPQADSFAVPVPAAVWLFATGLLGLVARRAKHTV